MRKSQIHQTMQFLSVLGTHCILFQSIFRSDWYRKMNKHQEVNYTNKVYYKVDSNIVEQTNKDCANSH